MINFGTTVHHGPDATTYTELTGIQDIDGGTQDTSKANSTHLASPSAFMTSEPGFTDPGQQTLNLIWNKTVWSTVAGFQTARATKFWKITCADGSKFEYQGWVMSLGKPVFPAAGSDDEVHFPVKIQQTGPTTYTAAA